jgi:hypothetical protein
MLTQCDDEGKEFVVAYVRRSNNATESRYSSYEGKCLVAMWVVAHFRCYLFGSGVGCCTLQVLLVWHTIYLSH